MYSFLSPKDRHGLTGANDRQEQPGQQCSVSHQSGGEAFTPRPLLISNVYEGKVLNFYRLRYINYGYRHCEPQAQAELSGACRKLRAHHPGWGIAQTHSRQSTTVAPVRTLIRKGLEAQSWLEVCGEACDGMEAIEKARDLKPDLIVLDLSMPGMNGLEAAVKVQRILPRVPIILFTVHYEAAAKCAGLSGIRAVLSKAAPMDALFAEIQRVLVAA